MADQHNQLARRAELALQPPIYEIRIRGRLDSSHWAEWFDGMTMVVDERGETVLTGPLTDQAALYGLLSRLRDLALPLISVRAVAPGDGEGGRSGGERRRGEGSPGKINWLLIVVYLLLGGGLSALTVFLTAEAQVHTALALALLFAALGGIAYAFDVSGGGRGWRIVAVTGWAAAFITLIIYLAVVGWLHPALTAALFCFLLGGGLLAAFSRRRSARARALRAGVQWQKLGDMPEPGEAWEPYRERRDE